MKTIIHAGQRTVNMNKGRFLKNIASIMGHDTAKVQCEMVKTGKTVTRIYTNTWIKYKSPGSLPNDWHQLLQLFKT